LTKDLFSSIFLFKVSSYSFILFSNSFLNLLFSISSSSSFYLKSSLSFTNSDYNSWTLVSLSVNLYLKSYLSLSIFLMSSSYPDLSYSISSFLSYISLKWSLRIFSFSLYSCKFFSFRFSMALSFSFYI